MKPRRPSPALVISIIALVMATTGSAVAAVNFARNAGKVDGKDARAATSSLARAAGDLVATNRTGPDRGKIPGKFVADTMRGGTLPFGRLIEVVDNSNGAPQVLTGVPGLGTLTASCQDQSDRAGREDPRLTLSFANESGGTINISRRVGNGDGAVALMQPGIVDTFVITGSNTFEVHAERDLNNLRVEGVVRQDGANTGAAVCLVYGFGLRV